MWHPDNAELRNEKKGRFLSFLKDRSRCSALSITRHNTLCAELDIRVQKLLDSFLDELIDREAFTTEKAKLMGQKKLLEEQKAAHAAGRSDWLEPFQSWVLTAKNTGEIAVSSSLQEKRDLALKVFGTNLVLDCKKARGSCVKPWSFISETPQTGGVVRARGLEPPILSEPDPKSGASAIPPRAR